MRKAAAFLAYWLGLTLGLWAIFEMARGADWWEFPFVPLYALPIWWIAAGIGIRLGVRPSEFFHATAAAVGLLDPPSEANQDVNHSPN
jgi:hypothetical protein